jgi:hypothetical protein
MRGTGREQSGISHFPRPARELAEPCTCSTKGLTFFEPGDGGDLSEASVGDWALLDESEDSFSSPH